MDKINFNTVTLLLLLISSFAFSSVFNKKFKRFLFLSGTEFIAIGLILGSQYGMGLMTPSRLMAFQPLIALIIGLFGFLFGLETLQIKIKSEESLSGALLHGLVLLGSAVIMFYVSVALFPQFSQVPNRLIATKTITFFGHEYSFAGSDAHVWLALTLGSMAAVSSVNGIRHRLTSSSSRGPFTDKLPSLAAPGEILGIFVFGAVFAGYRALESSTTLGWTITEWTVAVIGMGCFCGLLFRLFIGREKSHLTVYLATIGVVPLVSGMAMAVGISPLFLNFVCGATLALSASVAEPIAEILGDLRNPLTIIILFFAGASIGPLEPSIGLVAALLIASRLLLLRWLPPFSFRHLGLISLPPHPGRGFYIQDILVVVIGMDMEMRAVGISQIVLITALICYVFFKFAGHLAIVNFLADSCETETAVTTAPTHSEPMQRDSL